MSGLCILAISRINRILLYATSRKMLQIQLKQMCLLVSDLAGETEDVSNTLMARRHGDAERHGRAARETVVLREVNRLVGELLHVEGPEETGDGEENLLLGEGNTRADAATVIMARLVLTLEASTLR